MRTPSLRTSLAIVLVLTLVAGALGHPAFGALPGAAALVLGGLRLRKPLLDLLDAREVSRRSTLSLIATFAIALVPGGHGVAPVGLFLIHGWERFLAATLLGWLAVLVLGASAFLWRHAPALGFLGGLVALLAWALFQGASDEPLLGALASLPFLVCLFVHSMHLWRIRALEPLSRT